MRAEAEARLRAIAKEQHQVFTRAQALAAGLSPRMLDRGLREGASRRMHAGVYVPAAVPITWRQQLSAALLACGPEAVASHRAAAAVWGFAEDLFVCEVTVPSNVKRRHDGIRVYRAGVIDAMHRDGFRVTKPGRTIVDLADVIAEDRLARIVDDAHRRRLVDLRRLHGDLSLPANRNRPGSRVLRKILASRDPDRAIDSDLESLFFEALRECGVPLPVPQYPVMTLRGEKFIDFAYPDQMVAIELDGWDSHGTRRAFEEDRPRQNELERLGFRFNRFTWRQVETDGVGVAVMVGLTIGLVPSRWKRAKGSTVRSNGAAFGQQRNIKSA